MSTVDLFEWMKQRDLPVHNRKLIERAFIHSSYVNEHKNTQFDNERLEFMGDAVLQFWISVKLYQLQPTLDEGQMTVYRASMVCEKALAKYGKELELNQFLKLGIGEEKNGGRQRDSIVADMMEAFLGALYLDSGLGSIQKILGSVIDFHSEAEINPIQVDYKTQLQEFVQADRRQSVRYEVLHVSGPSNLPEFEVAVKLDDITLGVGKGNSKKKAEQAAAQQAFEKLVK
ncbi:MAG: ribonuclease III [Erysipelotrichaceae bacterium]|nr:ribonuclease III [Erysipelotrichaceae bacterium]